MWDAAKAGYLRGCKATFVFFNFSSLVGVAVMSEALGMDDDSWPPMPLLYRITIRRGEIET